VSVVEILAVGRGNGSDGVEPLIRTLIRFSPELGDLNAPTTLYVVHPKLKRRHGKLGCARHNYELAVRCPPGRGKCAPLVLAQLFGLGAVGLGDPDVFGAVAIADESDPLPIARVTRLAV